MCPTENVNKPKSPFDLIQNTLNILSSLGGYPLVIDHEGKLTVSKSSYIKQLIMLILANLGTALFTVIIFTEAGIEQLTHNKSFTRLDIASGFAGSSAAVATSLVLYILFVKKRCELQCLLKMFADVSFMFQVKDMSRRCLKGAKRITFIKTVFVVGNVVSLAAFNYFLMHDTAPKLQDNQPILYYSYLLFGPLSAIFGYFHPIIVSTDIIIYYLIIYLKEHFYEWRSKIEIQNNAEEDGLMNDLIENNVHRIDIEEVDACRHIKVGIKLCQLIEELNCFLAPFILCQVSFCIFGATFSALNCSSMFFNITNITRIFYGLCFICFTTYLLLSLFYYCTAGQMLADELQSCNQAWEFYTCTAGSDMDKDTKLLSKFLLSRLNASKCIFPKAFFKLNHKTYVAATAAIFTYFIVLLQFRIDEK